MSYLHLKDNDTYQEILEELEERLEKGMDVNKAIRRVIPRHTTTFAALFNQDDETEEEAMDEESIDA